MQHDNNNDRSVGIRDVDGNSFKNDTSWKIHSFHKNSNAVRDVGFREKIGIFPFYSELKKDQEDLKRNIVLPQEILIMDEDAIALFKKALLYGKETDRSIRIMVVGHSGVGKTTLSKHILGDSRNDTPTKSTNGIDVHVKRCKIQLDSGVWLPISEESQDVSMYHRLANSIRALRENEQSIPFGRKGTKSEPMDSSNNTTHDVKPITGIVAHVKENEHGAKLKSVKPITDASAHVKANEHGEKVKSKQDSDRTVSRSKRLYHDEQYLWSSANSESYSKKELSEVIEEVQKRCTSVEKNTCDVSLWDFAGQYVFYCTHQVFLSRRAIYLLVTDLTKHLLGYVQDTCYIDSDGLNTRTLSEFVTFWMNSIHTYCGAGKDGSPHVILIGTFADELPKKKRKELASIFFKNLRMILVDTETFIHLVDEDFDIDNKSQDPQINSLKNKILEVAMKQSWWHEELPTKWVSLERKLRKSKDEGKKVLHREALMTLNEELTVPIETDEELELFLRFHHDTGNILYFSDAQMRDYIVLDPQWLVDAFKSLITAEQFCKMNKQRLKMWREFDRTAILNMEFIDNLWEMDGVNKLFATHKSILLQYMEKLKIIAKPLKEYQSNSKKHEIDYLVPCMLKERPPPDVVFYHATKCHRKSTSILCFASESNLIPPYIFNMLLAACIVRWNIATSNRILVLYCGYAEFEVNEVHILHLHFSNNVIQIWLEKYSPNDPEDPDEQICAEVKNFIESCLKQEVKHRYPITIYFKCPRDTNHDIQHMIRFDDLLVKNQRCKVHDTCQVFTSRDLRYWIPSAGKSETSCVVHSKETVNSFTYKTSPTCNRGLFLDTQGQEETVWVSKMKATIAQGVCKIYTLSGTGTGFRVGSCYVMTASHVVKTLDENIGSHITGFYAIFNCLHETEITEENKFFFKDLVFFDEHLDTAVLELKPRIEKPFPEQFFYFSAPVYHDIFLIGHSKGAVMATTHVDKHVELNENNITYLHNLQERCSLTYGLNYDYDNQHLKNVLNNDRILFHCKFVHGASGAPGVFINDRDVVVTTMLLGGYPVWYYDDIKRSWPPEDCVEQGVNMQSLYRAMKIKDPKLCQDIFGQTIKYMAID